LLPTKSYSLWQIWNQDSSVSIVTGPRAGRLRSRVSFLAKDMRFYSWSLRRYLLWYPRSPLCDGCFVFAMKRSSLRVNLITHPHPVPRLRIDGAVPPFPYVFMACCFNWSER
jgi:hypothetical protein